MLNLYRYDEEEFHYADGRLLLRGNNGSGKSRVLALQLPFLLDGEATPARVEPDGDAAKRIEWNLLMGRHKDRTGYTWIEFGRRSPDGTDHFLTLGCGLRAVEGHTGLQSRWFFITPRRIGRDLALLNEQRIPLGRDRLAERLGGDGRIFQKVDEYRRAVDEALFGLGPRYGALIELLLRLRRPQLTRKLDENELPEALSEALPTLSTTIVEEVAESFRGLQADKDTLRDFTVARAAVDAFLREYARYLRIAVRQRAAHVRRAQSAYEDAQRTAKLAQTRHEEASAALAALDTALSELRTRSSAAESDERTLAESPEMKTAEEIRLAGQIAAATAKSLDQARTDETSARHTADLAASRLRQAEEAFVNQSQTCAHALGVAETAARHADLGELHHQHLPASTSEIATLTFQAGSQAALDRILTRRAEAVKRLREREQLLRSAEASLALAEQALRDAQAATTVARDEEHTAREALARHAGEFTATYTAWQSALRYLHAAPPSDLAESFAVWLERREGPAPFRSAAEAALAVARDAFAARALALEQNATALSSRIQEIDGEIGRLEHGETQPPPPPLTRRADRQGRPGAPLWQICDFRPELAPSECAGLEAALQASGLLDAWVLPDGRLLAPDEDSFLVHPSASASTPARSLGEFLIPAIDPESPGARQLSPEIVAGLLAAIGSVPDEGACWVAKDGSWRLGPLAGRWSKPEADYLGEGTRAAARRRQLERLRADLRETEAVLAKTRDAQAGLSQERAAAEAEFAAAPDEEPLRRAGYDLETASRLVTTGMLAEEKVGRLADSRRAARAEADEKLQTDAADLGLSSWIRRLDLLSEATQAYTTALAALWPTLRHTEAQLAQLGLAREQEQAAADTHSALRARHESAAGDEAAARQRFETLRDTHGQTAAHVLARHAAAVVTVAQLKDEIERNQEQRVTRTGEQSAAQEQWRAANEKRETQEGLRSTAIARLRELAEHRLLAEAVPAIEASADEGPWSVTHAVELARALDTALEDASLAPEVWRQRQDQILGHIQELRDRLIPHGHQPETHQLDDLVLVRCHFQARPHTMTELQAAFVAEIEARGRLLQEREREIIENHLLAEAAVELQKLIRSADNWKIAANREMHERPTSTGIRFRFQWEADTEIRFHEVRPILLQRGELWTPAERSAVSTFLQGRIAAEQAADESGSWRDHLARALDYRRWHRFAIERQQEGQWKRLNKTTYGTGSGGEKALALTLPRFAAAAAHYSGAAPTAPRLVMLDEAFAGIDPTMRAQCLGVLAQFDLDVVMTSELEWGCYATVPALAIYHLTTLPGIDAVASTRWLWNGRERRQVDHAAPG